MSIYAGTFEWVKGADFAPTMTLTTDAGVPVNLTGVVITSAMATFDGTIIDWVPITLSDQSLYPGVFTGVLSDARTLLWPDSHEWDLRFAYPDGTIVYPTKKYLFISRAAVTPP